MLLGQATEAVKIGANAIAGAEGRSDLTYIVVCVILLSAVYLAVRMVRIDIPAHDQARKREDAKIELANEKAELDRETAEHLKKVTTQLADSTEQTQMMVADLLTSSETVKAHSKSLRDQHIIAIEAELEDETLDPTRKSTLKRRLEILKRGNGH